jgi:hypothetical protein
MRVFWGRVREREGKMRDKKDGFNKKKVKIRNGEMGRREGKHNEEKGSEFSISYISALYRNIF